MDSTYNLHVHIVECHHNAVQCTRYYYWHCNDRNITTDTPHLTLMGEMWDVTCEGFGRKLTASTRHRTVRAYRWASARKTQLPPPPHPPTPPPHPPTHPHPPPPPPPPPPTPHPHPPPPHPPPPTPPPPTPPPHPPPHPPLTNTDNILKNIVLISSLIRYGKRSKKPNWAYGLQVWYSGWLIISK